MIHPLGLLLMSPFICLSFVMALMLGVGWVAYLIAVFMFFIGLWFLLKSRSEEI